MEFEICSLMPVELESGGQAVSWSKIFSMHYNNNNIYRPPIIGLYIIPTYIHSCSKYIIASLECHKLTVWRDKAGIINNIYYDGRFQQVVGQANGTLPYLLMVII